ncbi:MAG: ribonuclease Z [bacterium]
MEVVLLGTGAALPTPRRRPSSAALIREDEILLFDCGEGAQIQFQKAQLKPGKLTKIFISHLHGDHFYGLIGLLTSFQLLGRSKPISLWGPQGIGSYVNFMQKLSRLSFNYQIDVHEVAAGTTETHWDFGEYRIVAMPLEHSIFTLGFRLQDKARPGKFFIEKAEQLGVPEGPLRGKLQKGETITLPSGLEIKPSDILGSPRPGKIVAFCLDTRPCENSLRLAYNTDLVVHDGTFDEEQKEWAHSTGHCTVKQAAEIAEKAGAKKLVLSHISARYKAEDAQRLLNEAQTVFKNSILAHDLLRLRV